MKTQEESPSFYSNDSGLDFIDVCHPLVILSTLYLMKIVLCRTETTMEVSIITICLYSLIFIGYCLFDKPLSNVHEYDPPYWHLAIPIGGILLCEGWLNLKEFWFTEDLRTRIFYHFDAPLKRFFVGAHMVACIAYCILITV